MLAGGEARLPVRLVMQRLPRAQADARRAKLRQDARRKGRTPSQQALALCCVSMYLTSLPEGEWPPEQVAALYAIRWQIEVMFKAWKSVLKVGRACPMKPFRFLCLMYGQMVWALLNCKLFAWFKATVWNACRVELSELKGIKVLATLSNRLKDALTAACGDAYREYLAMAYSALCRLAVKKPKKNKESILFQ